MAGDAFRLDELGTKFDTVVDSGLFHIFSDQESPLFTKSLRSSIATHGTYFMLSFSTKEPTGWGGPRRVSEKEIRDIFKPGWKINYIKDCKIETTLHPKGGNGLLSSISKD